MIDTFHELFCGCIFVFLPPTFWQRTITTTWRKKQAKESTREFDQSQNISHWNILIFDTSIRKFEHFNVRTLVTTHIMKALWIKNGTIFVHLQRYFIERRFINTSGQGISSENSYQRFSCLHDKVGSQKWRNFQSSTRTRERVWQILSCSWKMWWCSWTSF